MDWGETIGAVRPHVVKIETPRGYGTGFLAFYNHDKTWCGIATAAHVVSMAEEWQEPIRISNDASESPRFLQESDRVIFVDKIRDSAVVLFRKSDLKLPEVPIGLLPTNTPCGIGVEIGWLGYPGIEPNTMCFFSGNVSARQEDRRAYLIDGVAINGVSGGPVFHSPDPKNIQIIGTVSAYHANRTTGEALPGLLRAQDVSQFSAVATYVQNMDEANRRKREFEASQAAAKLASETAQELVPIEAAPISTVARE